jgi:hypothetical protein
MHAPRSSYDGPTATIRAIRPRRLNWLLIAAYLAGIAGLALGVTVLVLLLVTESSTNAQLTQLKQEISGMNTRVGKISDSSSSLSRQAGGLSNSVNSLLPLSSYTTICSQYLTGPNGGPATYYFPCTGTRP